MKPVQMLRALILMTALAVMAAPASYGEGPERTTTTTGKAYAKRGPVSSGIPRFAEICTGISRGGDPGPTGIRYLHDHGFKTVISFLADKNESLQVAQAGMRWVHIPMHSWYFSADPPTPTQLNQFLTVVEDSTQFPVFIHCKAGKDRTGAMTAVYRIQACGWTKDEAIEEMNSFGFAGRYKGLRQFVENYTKAPGTAVASATPTTAAPQNNSLAGASQTTVAPTGASEVSSPAVRQ